MVCAEHQCQTRPCAWPRRRPHWWWRPIEMWRWMGHFGAIASYCNCHGDCLYWHCCKNSWVPRGTESNFASMRRDHHCYSCDGDWYDWRDDTAAETTSPPPRARHPLGDCYCYGHDLLPPSRARLPVAGANSLIGPFRRDHHHRPNVHTDLVL